LLTACEPRSSVAHPQIFQQKIGGGVISEKENRLLDVFTHWQLIQLVNDHKTSATDQLAQDHRRGFGSVLHREEAECVGNIPAGSVWIIQERRISLHQNC
jgi:hypothetical protein